MAAITKEVVENVMKYSKKFPTMTTEELSVMCGCSRASVSNILNGMYNYLLEEGNGEKTVKSEIPYSDYKKLVVCEIAINELIEAASKSSCDDGFLFLSYKSFSTIIERYFPEQYAKRLAEVEKEKNSDIVTLSPWRKENV